MKELHSVRRRVTWKMGKMYGRGWVQGSIEASADVKEQYHLSGITYSELYRLLINRGRVTTRRKSYPMIFLNLSLKDDDFYYIKSIYEKHRWSRFQQWAKGTQIQLIWEGENAQALIRKLQRYISVFDKSDDLSLVLERRIFRVMSLAALKWIPKGGQDVIEEVDVPEDISVW